MLIKCKMCGGDIEFTPGATYGTCEYCGSTSTIPKAEDETKLNRYNRANHFRRQCEFDKALTAYEKLLEQDDTDAEAHWGAVISRYGIEYVEDPATGRRVPTCHRVQVASILADADYLAALENAPDAESRRLYEEQAAEIAEIQKGILAISANEKPYDVFICYKETDENGQRTRDSQWAQEVYYGLTEQGYKVFFSRITLEDKLGQQYEPYIFAALNSARVMVVIGSRPEHFNAVWVKNEWGRYLALMARDRKRLLIPCYRGMDPYDLPEELSALQSQDMSKIGFMQDLLRGIRKVLDAEKKPEPIEQPRTRRRAAQAQDEGTVGPGAASLLKRAQLFMEDGAFDDAGTYLDRVLDIDPECAEAYAAKVCVAFSLPREGALAEVTFLYEDNADWKKAMRFADDQQRGVYTGYIEQVRQRVAYQIRNYAFDCAMDMAVNPRANQKALNEELQNYQYSCSVSNGSRPDGSRRPKSEENAKAFSFAVQNSDPGDVDQSAYATAAAMFERIGDEEAITCAELCRMLGEQARQKAAYNEAMTVKRRYSFDPKGFDRAAELFLSVQNYLDAADQAEECRERAEAIRADLYHRAVQAMNEAGKSSSGWEQAINKLARAELDDYKKVPEYRVIAQRRLKMYIEAEKRRKLLFKVMILVLLTVFVLAAIVTLELYYREGINLLNQGKYQESAEVFSALSAYRDAGELLQESYYREAEALLAAGQYQQALEAVAALEEYKDAAERVSEVHYAHAEALLASGDQIGAAEAFMRAGDYQDAAVRSKELFYVEAESLLADGDQDGAAEAFARAVGYQDALTRYCNMKYAQGEGTVAAGSYHTVGLKRDGTVVAVGGNVNGQCNVSGWTDIVAVAAGSYHTVGLKRDGSVVAVGSNDKGQCDVSGWTDIVAVAAGYGHTVGLKRDGSVVAVGRNTEDQCEVSGWTDIIAVAAGYGHTVGLKRDGSVVAVGENYYGQCEVSGWTDIVAVAAGDNHTVGLKQDGTVVAVGRNVFDQCNVSGWTDIVAVAAGDSHTVGLKQDGTVAVVGYNKYGQCDVSNWTDVVAIAAGSQHTVGLKQDGTVVAVGYNYYGQCDVSGWTDIGGGLTLE